VKGSSRHVGEKKGGYITSKIAWKKKGGRRSYKKQQLSMMKEKGEERREKGALSS